MLQVRTVIGAFHIVQLGHALWYLKICISLVVHFTSRLTSNEANVYVLKSICSIHFDDVLFQDSEIMFPLCMH